MKYCCIDCFESSYLKDVIKSSDKIGDCSFCNTKEVKLYPASYLADILRNILFVYKLDNKSHHNIGERISIDFKSSIFSNKVKSRLNLLAQIFSKDPELNKKLFTSNVSLTIETGGGVTDLWTSFKNEIKSKNRFHLSQTLDLVKLRKIFEFEYLNMRFPEGTSLYRGRISDNNGYPAEEMKNPPPGLARPGRANPKGISYLYLANDIDTTLREIRAGKFDYVTIAEIVSKEDLKILDLHNISFDPVPWIDNDEVHNYLNYRPFLEQLVKDLSKPIRKKDKEIDYIPSQYISEFCKSIDFDGIAYDSSFSHSGYNLAMFNSAQFQVKEVKLYHIDDIELKKSEIISDV